MHMLVYFLEPGEGPLQDELLGCRWPGTTATSCSSTRLARNWGCP